MPVLDEKTEIVLADQAGPTNELEIESFDNTLKQPRREQAWRDCAELLGIKAVPTLSFATAPSYASAFESLVNQQINVSEFGSGNFIEPFEMGMLANNTDRETFRNLETDLAALFEDIGHSYAIEFTHDMIEHPSVLFQKIVSGTLVDSDVKEFGYLDDLEQTQEYFFKAIEEIRAGLPFEDAQRIEAVAYSKGLQVAYELDLLEQVREAFGDSLGGKDFSLDRAEFAYDPASKSARVSFLTHDQELSIKFAMDQNDNFVIDSDNEPQIRQRGLEDRFFSVETESKLGELVRAFDQEIECTVHGVPGVYSGLIASVERMNSSVDKALFRELSSTMQSEIAEKLFEKDEYGIKPQESDLNGIMSTVVKVSSRYYYDLVVDSRDLDSGADPVSDSITDERPAIVVGFIVDDGTEIVSAFVSVREYEGRGNAEVRLIRNPEDIDRLRQEMQFPESQVRDPEQLVSR